jgi:hypothetical protein
MSELTEILREAYKKKEERKPIDFSMLMEMVEHLYDAIEPEVVEEAKEPAVRTYHISEIPLIPISELGWANADDSTITDDPEIPASQRRGLEQYLSSIPGSGFADKLNAVSKILKEGINSIPQDNPRTFIQQAMAFLVFYKTLTMAITNFNAAAAGFNFEAFLAALMNGRQIPATGAKTIADITAEVDGVRLPVSLKLYRDEGLEVGGSYFDLCNDLLAPKPDWSAWVDGNPEFDGGAMRYIAATKQLEGEGVEQEGTIKLYQFDVTRKNLFDLLARTAKGKSCIQSNRAFMNALTHYMKTGEETDVLKWATNVPAKSDTSDSAELSSAWSDYLDNTPVSWPEELNEVQISAIKEALVKMYKETIEGTQSGNVLAPPGSQRVQLAQSLNPEANVSGKGSRADPANVLAKFIIGNIVTPLFKDFKAEYIKKRDARAQFFNSVEEWVTGDEAAIWYNDLNTPELKAAAIRNTRGYLGHYHWVIPRGQVIQLGGGKPFAALEIGGRVVMRVLESARGELMDMVFDIFNQMALMSEKLNAFFAHGLREPEEAKAGAQAGETAAAQARQMAAPAPTTRTPDIPGTTGMASGRMMEEKDLTSEEDVVIIELER